MDQLELISVLNRLLGVLRRSLPRYLEEAKPFSSRDNQQLIETLERITTDQRLFASRVADAILHHGGRPSPGRFPSEFAAANDLSLDFLLERLIEYQHHDVEAMECCAADLAEVAPMRLLAEEAMNNAKEHKKILEGMTKHE